MNTNTFNYQQPLASTGAASRMMNRIKEQKVIAERDKFRKSLEKIEKMSKTYENENGSISAMSDDDDELIDDDQVVFDEKEISGIYRMEEMNQTPPLPEEIE